MILVNFVPQESLATDNAAQVPGLLAGKISSASVTGESQALAPRLSKRANFKRELASSETRHVADWVVDSGNNHKLPFLIIDKVEARIFVFSPDGQLHGAAPVLIGQAKGDEAVPGIGERKLSSIHADERTTSAGRFVSSLGHNLSGAEIVWVDYDSAISIHPVITGRPKERRLQRLATPTPLDNRITYGCINVAALFYKNVVRQAFTRSNAIVYVLPETRSAREVFGSYDLEENVLR